MLQKSDPETSQKDQFRQAFLSIKKNITTGDRINCAAEIKRSKLTVDRYINGHVYDNSTAFDILSCLKKRIAERNNLLKSHIAA